MAPGARTSDDDIAPAHGDDGRQPVRRRGRSARDGRPVAAPCHGWLLHPGHRMARLWSGPCGAGRAVLTGLQVRRLADASDLPRADGKCCWHATPLRHHPLLLQTTNLDLSGLTLQTGRSTPLAVLGAVPAETAWILLPLDGRASLRLGGRAPDACSVAVFGAGAEYEMANRSDVSWGLVAMPAASLRTLLSPPRRSAILRPGATVWLHVDAGAWAQAATLMQDAAEVMAADPAVFEVPEARRSLRASVLEACHELLSGPPGGEAPRSLGGAAPALRRVVRAADAYLARHPAPIIDTAMLGAAIGVPKARLQAAFRAVLGVSAARYLLTRRLVLARAALRSPAGHRASVEETALAHGFRNRRHFERAWRAMFREAPPAG